MRIFKSKCVSFYRQIIVSRQNHRKYNGYKLEIQAFIRQWSPGNCVENYLQSRKGYYYLQM